MTNKKSWLLIGILVILTTLGVPLLKSGTNLVKADNPIWYETQEYITAKKLVESNLRMNCAQLKNLWLVLFPDGKCYHMITSVGGHWYCLVNAEKNLFIDFNWHLDLKGRLFQK